MAEDTKLHVGDIARIIATCRDLNGALADPTGITGEYQRPDGTGAALPIFAKLSLGVWASDLPLTQSGLYRYKVTSTGAVAASDQDIIEVEREVF